MEIGIWRPPPQKPQYVIDFMNSIDEQKAKEKITAGLARLKAYGILALLRTEEVKKIEDNVFELRVKYNKREFRISFCPYKEKYWLVHGFIKKKQNTPTREIDTARNRTRELMHVM